MKKWIIGGAIAAMALGGIAWAASGDCSGSCAASCGAEQSETSEAAPANKASETTAQVVVE